MNRGTTTCIRKSSKNSINEDISLHGLLKANYCTFNYSEGMMADCNYARSCRTSLNPPRNTRSKNAITYEKIYIRMRTWINVESYTPVNKTTFMAKREVFRCYTKKKCINCDYNLCLVSSKNLVRFFFWKGDCHPALN